jgi:putative hydrolase of HD superfamily
MQNKTSLCFLLLLFHILIDLMGKDAELQGLVKFFHLVENLKKEKRRGWLDRGVGNAESVADHSFRLALMAMVFSKRQNLDVCKAVKMAIVHDLPEAICGDVATRIKEELQQMPNKEKEAREEMAMQEMLLHLYEKNAREIRQLWNEFNARKTKEARLLYELDRLEAILQAAEYEKRGDFKASLQEFFDYANGRLKNRELKEFFALLMKERGK